MGVYTVSLKRENDFVTIKLDGKGAYNFNVIMFNLNNLRQLNGSKSIDGYKVKIQLSEVEKDIYLDFPTKEITDFFCSSFFKLMGETKSVEFQYDYDTGKLINMAPATEKNNQVMAKLSMHTELDNFVYYFYCDMESYYKFEELFKKYYDDFDYNDDHECEYVDLMLLDSKFTSEYIEEHMCLVYDKDCYEFLGTLTEVPESVRHLHTSNIRNFCKKES